MNTRTPHVHAELIKAWADGAEIQVWYSPAKGWCDLLDRNNPAWNPLSKYRVKPVPKPDVVVTRYVGLYARKNPVFLVEQPYIAGNIVEFTFDGETHELKSVRMI